MREPTGHRRAAHASVHVVASAEERARAFRQATRHTWFVRMMRLVLPVTAVVAMSSYGVLFFAASRLKGRGLEVGSVKIDPKNLSMQAPRYNGFGKDGSHYVVRAREAITDLKQSAPVRLNQISGEITQQSGVITYLKAVWGTYDQKKDVLELYEKIDIDGSTGMKARMTRATVLPKESRVISHEPVYAENETANIRSDRMTLNSKSRQATFNDRVHVKLKANQPAKPGADGQAKAAPKQSAPLGLAANSGQPIEVKSEQLDVDDNAKTALFRKDVFAKQGDATLQAPELDVLYEGKANLGDQPPATKDGQTPPEQQTKLKTIKARGGVQMTNKDDHATADTLDYDAATEQAVLNGNVVMRSVNDRHAVASKAEVDQKADTVLLTGDVLVTQGKNTMKGRRLFVDRKAGTTRLETPGENWQPAGRIQTVFYQNEQKAAASKDARKPESAPTNASPFSFKTNPDAPIEIEATTLDVDDRSKKAIYKGNVIAKQGEFVVHTVQMTAYYTGQTGLSAVAGAAATPAPAKGIKGDSSQQAQLTRVEARQQVTVIGKDGQQAIGEWGDFDVKANTVTLGGGVTVSQAKNVINCPKGAKFHMNMTTGVSTCDTEAEAGPAPVSKAVPAVSAASPAEANAPPPVPKPKERMKLVVYPKAAKDAAKKVAKDAGKEAHGAKAPGATSPAAPTASSAWESTTKPGVEKR